MRYALITLAVSTAVAVLPLGSAEAAAYPVNNKTLTDNPLYESGRLPSTSCPEKPIKRLSPSSAKTYLTGVLTCLNRTWESHLRKAGVKFSKPKATFSTKPPARFCGTKWDKDWVEYYCDDSKSLHIVLDKSLLKEPEDLYLFNLISMDYGQHVQNLTGIWRAYERTPYRNKAEEAEQNRRYNLQSDCLAATFIKSVWPSLDRDKEDWADLLYYLRDWAGKYNGSRKNITYWADRGFKSADPASCNTWAAPSSKVA
ncbi:neutral zinc metallopeptidase [Sphaerisporangium sp. B11E5]|uniref:neutral zinc metallopeptidase n=1 Tax=Sphaerisporangium sp. B11E5 TaxID=3153563 RepID=UPI00325E739A